MIPSQNIVEWSQTAPWAEQRQVEQDLIISRALVETFGDPFLASELRFRGGTALNKLHFPEPLRHSEDIDLVRTSAGAIGPILDRLRELLEPFLGPARFERSKVAPKIRFLVPAEDGGGHPIRLKLEINTRERTAYDPVVMAPFAVENPWFSGASTIPTFSNEEMLATKFRALLQRDKGRDLYDLAHGLVVFDGLDCGHVVNLFARYLADGGVQISRAQAEERMLAKFARGNLLMDLRPLLSADSAERMTDDATGRAIRAIFESLIGKMPGEPWAKTPEAKARLGIEW
ncbi:MAG: nucleotidyl transferase AbiEii/AbiGii toxin family protein [Boseongicola sp. SB0677_bin_26]|nr:nucleotidyl transferase AbiEii/AbiGii toxin family protein [Boseongicola sp. SB0665_bin_10]MYG28379.1 nucleotidyl transferase AbiEii/AbiGii toxin family protein [Boseongicola sp. SB0677_bin_26]